MPFDRLVPLASRLAGAVAEWHEQAGPHSAISPQVIFADENHNVDLRPAAAIQPTYLAPEQTGRLRCPVDERCDLYAVGVLLYQLATGRLPTDVDPTAANPAGIVRSPVPMRHLVPELPVPFEDIVRLLLAPLPQDRYQTALGLACDLRRCEAQWRTDGRVEPFLLACRDVPHRIRLSGRVYGQDRILDRLARIAERVRSTGRPEAAVVVAEDGLGKTAVLDAFANGVGLAGGRVAGGAFTPGAVMAYSGIADVVDGLGAQLLADAAAAGDRRRAQDLREAIGPCAAALADLTATMAAGLGPAGPATESVARTSAQHRLHLAIRRLVRLAARPGAPLVLTLDDLHHADAASVRLVHELLTDPGTRDVMMVATCSANLPTAHPVSSLLSDMEHVQVTSLTLRPLRDRALADLVADSLGTSRTESARLAREMAPRTGSTPLLATQFLHRLYERRELVFDPAGPRWRREPGSPTSAPGLDDLGEVVHERASRLAAGARRLLDAAAVLRIAVDRRVVAQVAGLSPEDAEDALRELLRAGFLERWAAGPAPQPPSTTAYRWTSGRVGRILASGLRSSERRALQVASGRALRSVIDPEEYSFFAAVDHLNAGTQTPTEPERLDLVQLNLLAGQRAWRVGVVPSAHHYLCRAVDLVSPRDWTAHYQLIFTAHTAAARAAYAVGDDTAAERMLDAAMSWAAGDVDRARLLRVRAAGATRRGDRETALGAAAAALALLDVRLPTEVPNGSTVDEIIERVRERLAGAEPTLRTKPGSGDRGQLVIEIAVDSLSPLAAGTDRPDLLAAVAVEASLDRGCTAASSLAFACLSVAFIRRYGDGQSAEQCLRAALRLLRERPDPDVATRVLPAVAFVLPLWLDSADAALDHLHQAYVAAVEHGEIGCARALATLHGAHRFLAGASLDSVASEITAAQWTAGRDDLEPFMAVACRTVEQAVNRLAGVGPDAEIPAPPGVDTVGSPDDRCAPGYVTTLCLTLQLAVACVLDERSTAARLADALAAADDGATSFVGAEATFYRALARAAGGEPATHQPGPLGAELAVLHRRLTSWAARAPALFEHKALLVSAEQARLAGDDEAAARRFDQAVGAARRYGCAHVEAMAAERAGGYAARRGDAARALAYAGRARACYAQWHARAKVERLDRSTYGSTMQPHPVDVDHLDLLALGNAMESLSGNLDLDAVVRGTTELLLQHAGADRACLLLVEGDGLRVAAVAANSHGEATFLPPPSSGALDTVVPLAVVDQVRATRQPVAVDHRNLADRLRDPYLVRNQPRAFLCAPLVRGDKLVAVAYLEHGRRSAATAGRDPHTMRLLSMHAANTLDHAMTRARLFEADGILDAVFGRLPVGLILLGPDLTVRRASPRAVKLTGLPIRPGVPVAELFDVLAPATPTTVPYALELAIACVSKGDDQPLHREITIVRPAGPQIRLHTAAVPVRGADRSLLGVALLLARPGEDD